MTWLPPALPNGVITSYTLHINYNNGTVDTRTVHGTIYQLILEDLNPNQEVSVRISASTSVGQGPLSNLMTTRTHEAGSEHDYHSLFMIMHVSYLIVPSAVRQLTVTVTIQYQC